MWLAEFEFGVESSKFVLKALNVDAELKAHIFDGSYNRLDFEIWYRHHMDFSPSQNKKSTIGGVSFVESGSDVYHGDSSAKCAFYFGIEAIC